MCHISAPPPLFFAGPLQAPLDWLFIGGALALPTLFVVGNYWRDSHLIFSGARRNGALALLGCAALSLLTFLVIEGAVVMPSSDALFAWWFSQLLHLDAHNCDTIALDNTYHHLLNGAIATGSTVALVFAGAGLGAFALWAIWVLPFSGRGLAQPASQWLAIDGVRGPPPPGTPEGHRPDV